MLLRNLEKGGPAWGWQCCALAYEYHRKGVDFAALMKTPEGFFENMEWYDEINRENSDPFYLARRWPYKYNALSIWQDAAPGGHRWFMEAYLMANTPDTEIAARMDEEVKVITEYKALFFNLSRGQSAPWMVKYIWEPAHSKEDRVFLYDYVLKTAALSGGADLVEIVTGPNMLTPSSDTFLKDIVHKERCTWALTKSASGVRVPNELALPVAARIVEAWDKTGEAVKTDADEGIKALTEAVKMTLKMSSPVGPQKEAKEKIVTK